MFLFGTSEAKAAPTFTPDDESRGIIADALQAVIAHLGPPAAVPRWLGDATALEVRVKRGSQWLDFTYDFVP